MSHFTVMVLSDGKKTVDELLAPYDEGITVEPYIRRTRAKIIEDAKELKERIKQRLEEKKLNGENFVIDEYEKQYLDAKTDDEFYACGKYDDELYDADGNELSTYNPKSKWDWYEVGGRWSGLVKAKKGVNVGRNEENYDCAILKDIDFSIDKKAYDQAIRYWEVVVEDSPLAPYEDKKDFIHFYKKEYYYDYYKDKETYAKICSSFTTFAVITPDGMWHEKGEMGWFGMNSATGNESLDWDLNFYDRFLKDADPNTIVTIVDCHI